MNEGHAGLRVGGQRTRGAEIPAALRWLLGVLLLTVCVSCAATGGETRGAAAAAGTLAAAAPEAEHTQGPGRAQRQGSCSERHVRNVSREQRQACSIRKRWMDRWIEREGRNSTGKSPFHFNFHTWGTLKAGLRLLYVTGGRAMAAHPSLNPPTTP